MIEFRPHGDPVAWAKRFDPHPTSYPLVADREGMVTVCARDSHPNARLFYLANADDVVAEVEVDDNKARRLWFQVPKERVADYIPNGI